ncbi:MAG: hypothetical protein NC935_04125 [Candidatus Omnitrophica bacterium]|nr:hypothetical protein [Candidatus Omnitrophota bacterium]
MVNLRNKFFFVIIPNFLKRKETVENLTKKILQNSPTSLNVLVLYSKELNLETFKNKTSFISFDSKKILIFKEITQLPPDVKDNFVENLTKLISNNYFIFETEKEYFDFIHDKRFSNDKFFKFLFQHATVIKASKANNISLFTEFKKYLNRADIEGTFYALEKLFSQYPNDDKLSLQILGMLVFKASLIEDITRKEYYLDELFKLDRALKEKNIDAKLAIEKTITKLLT